jgi:hypothetical protein
MNNPYSSLYSNVIDQILTWAAVIAVVLVSGFRAATDPGRAETFLLSACRAIVILGGIASLVFLVGIAGAALNINSGWWLIWELLCDGCVVAVFWVFPVLLAASILWSLIGRLACGYSGRAVVLPLIALALEILNAGLYFLVSKLME